LEPGDDRGSPERPLRIITLQNAGRDRAGASNSRAVLAKKKAGVEPAVVRGDKRQQNSFIVRASEQQDGQPSSMLARSSKQGEDASAAGRQMG